MAKGKSTSIAVSRQPALLNPSDFPEVTPLDQAAVRGFIRGMVSPDSQLYVAIDVVMWMKDEDYETAKKSLAYYRRKMKHDGTQLYQTLVQLKATSDDGKMYKVDMLTEEQVLRLVTDIPGNKSSVLKDWLAKLGAERLQQLRDAQFNALSDREKKYVREQMQHGVDQADAMATIPERIEGIDTFKALTDSIRDHVIGKVNYGEIINTEYRLLFGAFTDDLRRRLNTKSIRDSLKPLQLNAVKQADYALKVIIDNHPAMTYGDLLDIQENVLKPMGDHLAFICKLAGVDVVTGQPLLQARN